MLLLLEEETVAKLWGVAVELASVLLELPGESDFTVSSSYLCLSLRQVVLGKQGVTAHVYVAQSKRITDLLDPGAALITSVCSWLLSPVLLNTV